MFGNQKVTLQIEGMSCQHCVQTVTEALKSLAGVRSVKVDLSQDQAVVKFAAKQVEVSQMKDAVNQAGFQFVDSE
jgi:copper chaperone